jgi:hypothetical protein
MPSDARLQRVEREVRLRYPRKDSKTTLDKARAEWRELVAWAREVLEKGGPPKDDINLNLGQRWGLIAAKNGDDAFFEDCSECMDRMRNHGDRAIISLWAWHVMAHHVEVPKHPAQATRVFFETLESKAPDLEAALTRGIRGDPPEGTTLTPATQASVTPTPPSPSTSQETHTQAISTEAENKSQTPAWPILHALRDGDWLEEEDRFRAPDGVWYRKLREPRPWPWEIES